MAGPRYTWNAETLERVTIEPRVGGRIYATQATSARIDWGEVTVWEPGERLTHSFVMAQDARHPSQVTVDFVNDGAGTRVKFAHGAWSDANVDARAKFTEWPVILDRFAALAESDG